MWADPPETASLKGAPQTGSRDCSGPGPGVQNETLWPGGPLSPLCSVGGPRFRWSPLAPPDRLSVGDLARLGARVGPGREVASDSGVDLPIRPAAEWKAQSLTEEDEPMKVDKKITAKANKAPLTGVELVHILAHSDPVEFELYHLTEADSCRPYDLRVVRSREAGREHYIFSPDTVFHVTERGHGGLVSLAEWCREAAVWRALQEIPFFRDSRLRRAFTRWKINVRGILFQRNRRVLQEELLVAEPPFRKALLLLNRVLEEVRATPRLPLDGSRTFTLMEFRSQQTAMRQELLQALEKLSCHRAALLNAVKQRSYEDLQRLQLRLEHGNKTPGGRDEPLHLRLAHRQRLQEDVAQSEGVLHKLGRFAALVDQMTLQSLVAAARRDAESLLSGAVQRRSPGQRCLFLTELSVAASGALTMDPPLLRFQEAVSEALLAAGGAFIQMCVTCGLFLELSDSFFSSDESPASELARVQLALTGEDEDPATPLSVRGARVHGCYRPLLQTQLQWLLGTSDVAEQAEREQARAMQEAELQVQRLCKSYSWLLDVHAFIRRWSQASLESMKGQPAAAYEELVQTVRRWTQRVHAVPSSIATSNQLFVIQCTRLTERLGQQLRRVEEEVLQQLGEQIQLLSGGLVSILEEAAAELNTDPRDLHELSSYALTTREAVNSLADTQQRLDYIRSLQDAACRSYRKMTEQEVALEEKMRASWGRFIPLLKRAEGVVCSRLPCMASASDSMFSFLARELNRRVSEATSGPFLDPTRNARDMVSQLSHVRVHVHGLFAKLERLSRQSQNLHERPMDLTTVTAGVQKLSARCALWELMAESTTWREGWRQLLLSEVVVSQAQGNISKWKERALSLTRVIPTHDAVLQETSGILESLSCQVAFLAELQSPTLKHRHWKAIFQDMGQLYVPEKKVTVSQLMSQQLDQKLITKVCRDAQLECNMEQSFQTLRQGWKARLFQMDKFTLPVWQPGEPQHGLTVSDLQTARQHSWNDTRFIVIGLEMHFAELENDLMALSTTMTSPHSAEFRLQMEDWMQSMQELGKLLFLFERYQQVWAFLTKMFHDTCLSVQRVDLLEQFQPVDKEFKELMLTISRDPHVMNFVHSKKTNDRFHGDSLHQLLIDGLSTMEAISNQMVDLLESLCKQFPRLWFLSDREVIQLLSFHPTPFTLQRFVCKCFKGIRGVDVDREMPSNVSAVKSCGVTSQSPRPMTVLGFFGSLQEHITFMSPLEPNPNALVWLCVFEKQLRLTMVQHMKQCAIVRNQLEPSSQELACDEEVGDIRLHLAEKRKVVLPVLDLLSAYPLQCLLVAEETVWSKAVLQAFRESNPVDLRNLKAYNSAKLKTLGRFMREGVTGAKHESLVSKYTMMCFRALVQLTMKHAQQLSRLMEIQCELESSFEWLSLMKYHIDSDDWSLEGSADPTCYVDVLGHRLQYDYEYFGPEDWVMVHTPSTDRATLGILLALTSYRCGFVNGPCMSGKKMTVVQLGKALGRQVVDVQCWPSTRAGVVQRMLLGALQTGAWLLLDSADFLTQGVLSVLGQHLVYIHQSFSKFTRDTNQRVNKEPKQRPVDEVTGCRNIDSECHMVLAGKSISTRLSYGCVLISSKGNASEVPESLRCSTRPIALTHPDYRIVVEIMLSSIGFSEATSLSRRLVALIDLAKDSLCLPDFLSDPQSCYLVVLQKIVSASETHLQQSVRERELSLKAKGADLAPSRCVSAKETNEPSRCRRSHVSIVQGLMEETAIVKAVLSVVLPVLYEHNKASQFDLVFKDTFPLAYQFPLFKQYIEEEEKIQLNDAVKEELQRKHFHPDAKLISSAVTLYQTMKSSQAVLLLGPSGSGKTTCYCVLAGALNHLAAKAVEHRFENDNITEGDAQQADLQISASTWSSVQTVVLFPNAMSHEEVFGCFCEKRGWQDGAVAKVLRDSEQRESTSSPTCNKKKKSDHAAVKWLVMDGNPVGRPGWLDYLTTMCSPEDPFLYLPSGERLPSQSHLKLLLEATDLRDASPSAVTRCSLVYLTAIDLWKAVWKSEMDALLFEDKLHQGTLKMWNCLAGDLFSSTLSLLRQKALNSAVHPEGESLENVSYGLQEITSFVRILRALLQHFGKEVEKAKPITQMDKRDTYPHCKKELKARNLFLVAYIWGFSGHLHPRHQPQFDLLARQVLFTCRYKIVVPDEESVFEHFLNIDSKICPENTLLANATTPKYWRYTYLLKLMLEANQPVLLVGEPASGKTTLCKALLSVDKPHINLAASPLLSSRDLRSVLSNISRRTNPKVTLGSGTRQPVLLLWVDDLHEAPCDVFGKTSTALETLRQSISSGQVLTFDASTFKPLSAGSVSYMATCSIFGSGNRHSEAMSPRLSRLFSIFVLPSLSTDVILSLHSPRLKLWLQDTALKQSGEEMACCIITATEYLYRAVRDQFQPTLQRPHFIFSHHDLQKVFRGMCLWQPNIPDARIMQDKDCSPPGFPPASLLHVAHLWMHECTRTFSDRLCSEDERRTLVSLVAKTATAHFGQTQAEGQRLDPLNLPRTVQSNLEDGLASHEPSLLSASTSSEASLQTNPLQPQILKHMLDVMEDLVYGPKISRAPTTQQHSFIRSASYQARDLDTLLQNLCAPVDRREEDMGQEVAPDSNITDGCIVHRQRVRQLLRILRALLIPGGHGVLIGSDRGTGRKTTVRLAAHLAGCRLMEVHPENEERLRDILKEAGNQTREDGGHVVLLVHEGIGQSAREELLVAMAHPTYPGLYTEEELRDRVSRATAGTRSRRHMMDSFMFDQIHSNVHVFLLLPFTATPDDSESRRFNDQLAKALSCSICVEVYQPWSNQSLVEVASQCLKTSSHKKEAAGSEAGLSVAMALIHQSACRHASILLRAQPFSPHTYMEFIANFDYLCNHLHLQQQGNATRVATALARWEALTSTAEQRRRAVILLQEKVAETQQRQKNLLRAADCQRRQRDEARQQCVVEENRLCQLEEQIRHAHKQVEPAIQASLKVLSCLSASDLEEVRHYRDPPDGVVKVMDAVCLLFDRPPGWESARQLLGRSNFFQELEFFDRHSITDEQLQQLRPIVHSPQFAPESVLEASKACESLCRWVQAVYECCRMQRPLLVERQLAVLAQEAKGRLQLAEQRGEEAHRRQREVELQLQLVREELQDEELQLHTAESADRATAAAAGTLQTHVRAWRAAAQEAELNNRSLRGDALTLAAIISYLGPFRPETRTQLQSKWRELFETGSMDTNPEDPRTSLFTQSEATPPPRSLGFPIPVSERLQRPLGRALGVHWDAPPARLVVKLLLWSCSRACAQRCPLLADTQQHLDMSRLITGEKAELETETACELVVCADDPELLDKLDRAAERGLRVLVTHLERMSPSPLFVARLQRSARRSPPGSKCRVGPTHPEFCIFLSTRLPVQLVHSDIHPSILAQVCVVDLSLSSEDVQELLLTQLLQTECRKLLQQHLQLQNDQQLLQKSLAYEEDSLMDAVLQADTSLLQDAALLPRVAVSQAAVSRQQAEVQQLSATRQHHECLLAAPRQVARLAASFYRALQDVSRLSPAYYFSLRGFIAAVQGALVGGGARPEVTNRLAARVLAQYGPRLSRSHVAALELLLSAALLQHRGLCSEAERVAFLRGLRDMERPVAEGGPALPSWIPPRVHPELLRLEEIPVFSGLLASLRRHPAQWQQYLQLPSAGVAGAVPCHSHAHLSLLQRALLWRTLLPGCLGGLAEAMAAYHLRLPGHAAGPEGPRAENPEALWRYVVQHEGPVILMVPRHRGGGTSVQPLHLVSTLARCAAETTMVEVVPAPCDPEVVLSKLNAAAHDGRWLVLQLWERLDRAGAVHLSRLVSSLRDERRPVHPGFRFWIIAGEDASCSIQAAVRVCALLLVCEAPRGLKEELGRSLGQLLSVIQHRSLSALEPLVHCAVFHSVLLQRQTHERPAQGRSYCWTQEDLLALVDAHVYVSSVCHDSAEALRHIAVNLVHGGHVVHPADQQLLDSVAQTFLRREAPLWGAGPHIAADSTSCPDPSELLQMLEQSLQGPAGLNAPGVLGFGADVAADMIEIQSRELNSLLRASQTPPGAERSLCTRLRQLATLPAAADRLRAVRTRLKNTATGPAVSHGHLWDFLLAERDHLVQLAAALLSQLQRGAAPLLQLADLSRLERRAELIAAHLGHRDTTDPPTAYRLSAFRNARGLLVAVRRDAARVHRRHVSDVTLHFQVVSDSASPASPPLDAVYLCGLQLRGASWDTRRGALQDPAPLQPCSLPLVCVSPRVGGTSADTDTASPSPLYRCPLYLLGGGRGRDGDSADDDIITSLPLRTEINPVLCSLRRVRLESSL